MFYEHKIFRARESIKAAGGTEGTVWFGNFLSCSPYGAAKRRRTVIV
jgi:hypothetical protein